jgi:hypothetical protein
MNRLVTVPVVMLVAACSSSNVVVRVPWSSYVVDQIADDARHIRSIETADSLSLVPVFGSRPSVVSTGIELMDLQGVLRTVPAGAVREVVVVKPRKNHRNGMLGLVAGLTLGAIAGYATDGCEWASGVNCNTHERNRAIRWSLGTGVLGALIGFQMQKGGTTVYRFGDQWSLEAASTGFSFGLRLSGQ